MVKEVIRNGAIMLKQARQISIVGVGVVAVLILFNTYANAETQHGHDCATATTIALNTAGRGEFSDTGDRAVYRIVLERRGLLDVWTEAGNLDLWKTELLDASCNEISGIGAGDSVVGNGYVRIAVPNIDLIPSKNVWTLNSGTYFLRFVPDAVDVFGDPFIFHTSYIPHYGHDFKTSQPVGVPGSVDGALLYPMDREVFRITLSEPAAIHAWTTGPTASFLLMPINLEFADGSMAGDTQYEKGTRSEIVTSVLKPGTYYLSVEPASSQVP